MVTRTLYVRFIAPMHNSRDNAVRDLHCDVDVGEWVNVWCICRYLGLRLNRVAGHRGWTDRHKVTASRLQ